MKLYSKLKDVEIEELVDKCRLLRKKLEDSVMSLSEFAAYGCCEKILADEGDEEAIELELEVGKK
jgi:hypothetical protein